MGLKLLTKIQKRIFLAFATAFLSWAASMLLMVAAGIDPWLAHDMSLIAMFLVFGLFAWKPLKQSGVFERLAEYVQD